MSGDSLEIATLTPEARAEWLLELDRYQRECGCGPGAVAAGAAFILVLIWQILSISNLSLGISLMALAQLGGITAAAGIAGKLFGLARARRRFRRVSERLLRRGNHVQVHSVG